MKKPKGRIYYFKQRKRYYIDWYHAGKSYKIYRNLDGSLLLTKKDADNLLTIMRLEDQTRTFSINKYTKSFVDTSSYVQKWLKQVEPTLSPASVKAYRNFVYNYFVPYFEKNPCKLNDIQLDTLYEFLNTIDKAGSTKAAAFNCLHACLVYAWRSKRLQAVPPFPRRRDLGIIKKEIQWLKEIDQLTVLEAIPAIHQPIFYFLKYHLRRPAEARALHIKDYDCNKGVFTIHRTVSDRQVMERTKTGEIHTIPCHSAFKPMLEMMLAGRKRLNFISPFMFTTKSRQAGRRYTAAIMTRIWKQACKATGFDIQLYDGTKHSSCCQFVNEKGLSESQLMVITDHTDLKTVRKYAKTETATIRKLMETPRLDQIRKGKKVGSL